MLQQDGERSIGRKEAAGKAKVWPCVGCDVSFLF